MILKRVISGGQTGADQAGLFAAQQAGIPTGGFAPPKWWTSNGPNPRLLRDRFGLTEFVTASLTRYRARTWENVRQSDGTVRFAVNFHRHDEYCTLSAIRAFKRPYIDIQLPTNEVEATSLRLARWIADNKIETLNVAGNRETSKTPTFGMTALILSATFKRLKEGTY